MKPQPCHPRPSAAPGFSLLELMMVMVLILLAATFSQPIFQNVITHSREAALKDTLFTMRSMIHRFTLDHQRPPESLEEMVEKGYLGEVPIDPITRSRDTWLVDTEDFQLSSTETTLGITDVHPSADGLRPEGASTGRAGYSRRGKISTDRSVGDHIQQELRRMGLMG